MHRMVATAQLIGGLERSRMTAYYSSVCLYPDSDVRGPGQIKIKPRQAVLGVSGRINRRWRWFGTDDHSVLSTVWGI
jgi:hypothetical protein